MPGRKTEPDEKNFVECPKCSEEANEPVLVHKTHLVPHKKYLSSQTDGFTCPKGHKVDVPKEGA